MTSDKKQPDTSSYLIATEPYYLPAGDEIRIFEAAYDARLPVMLKGPTGCGKTRFVEHMSYRLKRPLITVACHEDLFASDLLGRYLLKKDETVWVDGPLTRAVRMGSICYLDEIVEARKDTTVVIHPLTDMRRTLSIDKKGEVIRAHSGFMVVISYNPGYQSVLKDLKQSTRQRFVSIDFDYPEAEKEAEIVANAIHLYVGDMSRPKVTFDSFEHSSGLAGFGRRIVGNHVWIDNITVSLIAQLPHNRPVRI